MAYLCERLEGHAKAPSLRRAGHIMAQLEEEFRRVRPILKAAGLTAMT